MTSMIHLSFRQTQAEQLVRAASTVLFNALERHGVTRRAVLDIAEQPRYGWTAKAEATAVGPRYVRITDLQDSKIRWDTVPFCRCDEPEPYLIHVNDILFARTGATTGKTHLVQSVERAVFASYLIRLRPKPDVLPQYLYAFFQSDAYWGQLVEGKEGSAQPNVNGQKLMRLTLPVPDLTIQAAVAHFIGIIRERQDGRKLELPDLPRPFVDERRIVARIEALAAKIAEARKLRDDASTESSYIIHRRLAEIFVELVASGGKHPLGDVICDAGYGTSVKCSYERQPGMVPVLRIPNVSAETTNLTDLKFGAVEGSALSGVTVDEEDLLIVRTNGSSDLVGRCAVARGLEERTAFASYLIRMKFEPSRLQPDFAQLMLRYLRDDGQLIDFARTTAGQYNVSLGRLRAAAIPLPPLQEQAAIVLAIGDLNARVKLLKERQRSIQVELDALLPTVLDRAFKGEL